MSPHTDSDLTTDTYYVNHESDNTGSRFFQFLFDPVVINMYVIISLGYFLTSGLSINRVRKDYFHNCVFKQCVE